jgi:hypothetical protein
MAAETDFHMTAEEIRKRVVQLRAYIDQVGADPEFELDDDESILDRVFTEDELEWIEEHEEKLHTALSRIDDDFTKVEDASVALHASQDAADAHVTVIEVAEAEEDLDAEEGAGDDDAAADDPDGDVEEED